MDSNIIKNIFLVLPPASKHLCINDWTIRSYAFFIKGMLEKHGHKVFFYDFLDKKNEFGSFYKSLIYKKVNSNVFCIVSFFSNRYTSLRLTKELKSISNNCKIVLMGPFAGIFYEKILRNYPIDLLVLQDPEFTLVKLFSKPLAEEFFKSTHNIAYKKDGAIYKTTINLNNDLDILPFVSFDFCANNYSPVPINTSRGCSFNCKFCDRKYLWGDKLRFRSIENIIEEIEILDNKFDCREIWFDDANFIMKRERTIDFCLMLLKKKLKIYWSCSTRVDSVDREVLKIMKMAGCKTIYYGVESGSELILRNIGKNYTQEQIITAIKLTKSIGMKAGLFLTIGNPGEDKFTINETKKLLLRVYPFDALNINPLIVLPGTELYNKFVSEGRINENSYFKNNNLIFYDSNWDSYRNEIMSIAKFFEICPLNTI